ncbi:MAG: hypothetical protein J7513_06165 [Solirubrobacteraceae bacterium]|nr:hypothetical protein [Solirubrobacteraceae bacterium]
MRQPPQSDLLPAERDAVATGPYGRGAMTLSHTHLIHRRGRRGSGKLMVTVFVAASRLVPTLDREKERDAIITDPYER